MKNSTQSPTSSSHTTPPLRYTVADLLAALLSNLPNLYAGQKYTLQQLVGDDAWYAIPTRHRKWLGHEFKHLVETTDQPVTWAGIKSDNSQLYELK